MNVSRRRIVELHSKHTSGKTRLHYICCISFCLYRRCLKQYFFSYFVDFSISRTLNSFSIGIEGYKINLMWSWIAIWLITLVSIHHIAAILHSLLFFRTSCKRWFAGFWSGLVLDVYSQLWNSNNLYMMYFLEYHLQKPYHFLL